ncbi:MAG TPA: cation:proton antiporter [Xanthobacteraceae bacterium]|nr:cation:proton antiporter [Xanthobacteraceae bacterium]
MWTELLNFKDPKFILLLQILVVVGIPLVLWRYLGLRRAFPLAIIQIFVGIVLGESIFGYFAPDAFKYLFGPPAVKLGVGTLAQVAVVLFVFLAGCEADRSIVNNAAGMILKIGVTGVFTPWILGGVTAFLIAGYYGAIPGSTVVGVRGDLLYAIAFGLCMAVTALPVLVIVLRELGFNQKPIGTVALAVGGVDDGLLWLSLALILPLAPLGVATQSFVSATTLIAFLFAIGGGIVVGLLIHFAINPLLNSLIKQNSPERTLMSAVIIAVFLCSAITELTGLHAVFGAFLLGLLMPEKLRHMAQDRFDVPVSLLLLPFFFLATGLKTKFEFGNSEMWFVFAIAMVVCISGKFLGVTIPAYLSGQSLPFSITLGTLMQCKGLMEIVVVTLLYERGVFGQSTFTALILVALVSTAITAPLSKLAQWYFGEAATQTREQEKVEVSVPTVPDLPQSEQAGEVVGDRAKVEGASLDFEHSIGKVAVSSPDVVIGRHKDDGIRVNDVRVSRGHARLQKLGDGTYEITNLTATRNEPNPITINGVEKEKAILHNGDLVSLNGVNFKFRNAA